MERVVLSVLELSVFALAVTLSWGAIVSTVSRRRPGFLWLDDLTNSARFLLCATLAMAGAALDSALAGPSHMPVGAAFLLLTAGPFLFAGVVALPRSTLSDEQRKRVLIDALMI